MLTVFSKIKKALVIAGAFALSILLTAFTYKQKGKAQERRNQQLHTLKEEREANRRMNNADIGNGASDSDNAEWLHERGQRPDRRS